MLRSNQERRAARVANTDRLRRPSALRQQGRGASEVESWRNQNRSSGHDRLRTARSRFWVRAAALGGSNALGGSREALERTDQVSRQEPDN